MPWVAGVDGCRAGWVVALLETGTGELRCELEPSFAGVLARPERPRFVAVDMPIGLLSAAQPGGRGCDRQARRVLGPGRASSVFSPPVRRALRYPGDYAAALRENRASSPHGLGISRQCFGLLPKLREVDGQMTPARQRRVREAHPELAFAALGGGRPVAVPKRRPEGRAARLRLLQRRADLGRLRPLLWRARRPGAAPDDVLDALVLAWTARRMLTGEARRLPERGPDRDRRSLRMEIWF